MNDFAHNVARLRKKLGLTQEALAGKLNLSFQAVSKWENAQSSPDISLLPDLACALETDIDSLLGYLPKKKQIIAYEQRYRTKEYYWGVEPQAMCYDILRLRPPTKPLHLLDVGCGEGKDAVFFAKNGYIVSAFDASSHGIEKANLFVRIKKYKKQACSLRLSLGKQANEILYFIFLNSITFCLYLQVFRV